MREARSARRRRITPVGVLIILMSGAIIRLVGGSRGVTVRSPGLQAAGVILLLAGLGLAVWARVQLGRNWGMPMTERAEPELVTTGPYRLVRHPIYSGILLRTGTALAINLYFLLAFGLALVYFVYSATVEERLLTAASPHTDPAYRTHTKMLIPYVL